MKQKTLENTIKQLHVTKPKNKLTGSQTPASGTNKETVKGKTNTTTTKLKSSNPNAKVADTNNVGNNERRPRKTKLPVRRQSVTPTKRKSK